MSTLPADQAIQRFKDNENRFDEFVNSETSYTASDGEVVESLKSFTKKLKSLAMETQTATDGQTVFTLQTFTYTPNVYALRVFRNGERLYKTDFTETDSSHVTLATGANAGDAFLFEGFQTTPLGTADAAQITFTRNAIVTAVQNALSDTMDIAGINVKGFGYGAKGDGLTDDTTALQNAFNAGGIVRIPKGTYLHTGLSIPAYTRVIGESRDNTVLTNKSNAHGITLQAVQSITIEDLTIDQSGNTNAVDCLYLIDTSNCYFRNLGITAPGRNGISLNAGPNSGVYNNTFVETSITSLAGTNKGVYLGNASGSTANNGNKFIGGRINNGEFGIYLDTLAGIANEFNMTIQDQTNVACHIDAAQNVFMGYYELNQSGAVIFDLTANAQSTLLAPYTCSANGGSSVLRLPTNAPGVANPEYTFIPPAGSGLQGRLENLSVNKLTSDVGSGLATASPILLLYRSVNSGGNAGSTETTIVDYSLPGNTLDSGGVGLRIKAFGASVNNANAKSFQLYVGGILMASGNIPVNGNNPWRLEFEMYRTASNTYQYYIEQLVQGNGEYQYNGSQTNVDLTAAVDIKLTLTGVANNDITNKGFTIEYLP